MYIFIKLCRHTLTGIVYMFIINTCKCMYTHACVCVLVCVPASVCLCERERERERDNIGLIGEFTSSSSYAYNISIF